MIITDISQLDPNGSYTYADYLTWRFTEYVELVKGRFLRKMAAPSSLHQQAVSRLNTEIGYYLKRQPCQVFPAPFDVRLLRSSGNGDEQIKTVVQPDICVVCDLGKIDARGCLGSPDWIMEVVSPSSLLLDTRTKFDLYAENGIAEYWVVYPKEQLVTAFVLTAEGEYELSGTYSEAGAMLVHTLPGFTIEWTDIFDDKK